MSKFNYRSPLLSKSHFLDTRHGCNRLLLTARKVKRIHDTRVPHQPAPVLLPRKTVMHVAERMRLIRQGDQREIAGVKAAIKEVRSGSGF